MAEQAHNPHSSKAKAKEPSVSSTPTVSTPLEAVKSALSDLSKRSASSESSPTQEIENPTVKDTIAQALKWAKRCGAGLNTARIALSIIESTIPIGIAYLSAKLVPSVVEIARTGSGLGELNLVLGLLAIAGVTQVTIGALRSRVEARCDARLFQNLHHDLLEAGIHLSPQQLEQPLIQNKITKVRENLGKLQENVKSLYGMVTQSVVLLGTAAALIPVSPSVAGVLTLLGVWGGFQAYRHGLESSVAEDKLADPRRQMWYSGWVLRDPSGLQNIKMSLRAGAFASKNVDEMKALDDAQLYVSDRHNTRTSLNALGIATVGSIATAYGLYSHIAGEISLAAALFMGAATGLFAARVATFSDTLGTWISSGFFVAEACGLQALSKKSKPREKELSPNEIDRWKAAPSITLDNVTVSASMRDRATDKEETRPILKNIKIDIRSCEFIGIVGCTGAGKTTLTKLLLGVRESSAGYIKVDDKPLVQIPLAELRANTSYLPQQWWNYAGKTVEQNIRIGNPIWEEDADIAHAVRDSGLEEVMRINGFNLKAVVGQEFRNGRQLSGGEMQLVALASALAKQGQLLILDEPTSRLDPDTAESVVKHLKTLQTSTRVLVSHDMGLVRQCDRIIVMRKETGETSPGIIEAIGTHEELINNSETYKRFFFKQAERFKDPL